jgi:hypothetical protein
VPVVVDDIFSSSIEKSYTHQSFFSYEINREPMKFSPASKNFEISQPKSFKHVTKKENVSGSCSTNEIQQTSSNDFCHVEMNSLQNSESAVQNGTYLKSSASERNLRGSCSIIEEPSGKKFQNYYSSAEKTLSTFEHQAERRSNNFERRENFRINSHDPPMFTENGDILNNMHKKKSVSSESVPEPVATSNSQALFFSKSEATREKNSFQKVHSASQVDEKILIQETYGRETVNFHSSSNEALSTAEPISKPADVASQIDLDVVNSQVNSENRNEGDEDVAVSNMHHTVSVPKEVNTVNAKDTATTSDQNLSNSIKQQSEVGKPFESVPATAVEASITDEIAKLPSTFEDLNSLDTVGHETLFTSVSIAVDRSHNIDLSINNKTPHVRENASDGIITIEILDDDDSDCGDTNHIGNEKQSQLNFSNSPLHLLQSNEIKREENEENHSPNFYIPNSDNSQNFLSSNKSSRNTESNGLNKLMNNSSNDSAKDVELSAIVISDSEDEILDAPPADSGEILNISDVPAQDFNNCEESEQLLLNDNQEELLNDSASLQDKSSLTSLKNQEISIEGKEEQQHVTEMNVTVGNAIDSHEEDIENATYFVCPPDAGSSETSINESNENIEESRCETLQDINAEDVIESQNIDSINMINVNENSDLHEEVNGSVEADNISDVNNVLVETHQYEVESTVLFEDQQITSVDLSQKTTDVTAVTTEDLEQCEAADAQVECSEREVTVEHTEDLLKNVKTDDLIQTERFDHDELVEQSDEAVIEDVNTINEVERSTVPSHVILPQQVVEEITEELTVVEETEVSTSYENADLVVPSKLRTCDEQSSNECVVTENVEIPAEEVESCVKPSSDFEIDRQNDAPAECEKQSDKAVVNEQFESSNFVNETETKGPVNTEIPATSLSEDQNEETVVIEPELSSTYENAKLIAVQGEQQNYLGQAVLSNVNVEPVKDNTLEVVDYSVTSQCVVDKPPVPQFQYTEPLQEENKFCQAYQHNLSMYSVEEQQLNSENLPSSDVTSEVEKEVVQKSQEVASTPVREPLSLYALSSTLNEVEYGEFNGQKKVGGDLELLANIAADQETLAVKTDSEKEMVDASDVETKSQIDDLLQTTPRRRKSKVKFECKKKARETLPRAVKQFQRRYPFKQEVNVEQVETTRVTRNRSIKQKTEIAFLKEPLKPSRGSRSDDSKYKPHDFIATENSTLPPRTNNVYAQKRFLDTNTTSEDSNDSCESTLFIDLGESLKNSEKIAKSIYEEETICDMLEFVTTENKTAVCISIPENEENCVADSFHILKQMEDFVDSNSQEFMSERSLEKEQGSNEKMELISEYSLESLSSDNSVPKPDVDGQGELKVVKTTDHSIENILNKTPPSTEVKIATFSNQIEFEKNDTPKLSGDEKDAPSLLQSLKIEAPNIVVHQDLNSKQLETLVDPAPDNSKVDISNTSEKVNTEVNDNLSFENKIEKEVRPPEVTCNGLEHNIHNAEDRAADKSVPTKNDEICEKTFKTKAAMKSYEDKLQPISFLQNDDKAIGMRTRLRSKSSEQIQQNIVRNRSLSVDVNTLSVPSDLLCKDSAISVENDKSNEVGEKFDVIVETDSAVAKEQDDLRTNVESFPKSVEREENSSQSIGQIPGEMENSLYEPEVVTSVDGTAGEVSSEKSEIATRELEREKLNDNSPEVEKSEDISNQECVDMDIEYSDVNAISKSSNVEELEVAMVPSSEDANTVSLSHDVKEVVVENVDAEQSVGDQEVATENSRQEEEPVTEGIKNVSKKKITDKGTKSIKPSDEVKARMLENTIKKMKEKIVESEKAKKERLSNLSSTEFDNGKTSLQESPEKKVPTGDVQVLKDNNSLEKKQHKRPHSEDGKSKSVEGSKKDDTHRKRERSRSSSKSRTSDKKGEQGVDKEKLERKHSRSRSLSKSRSSENPVKHHNDAENDRKHRSKSRSVDKEKSNNSHEDPKGHRKSRSRSSSKSNSLERKSKYNSSDRSSSKHKSSDPKDKLGSSEGIEDNRKKRSSSKSPPKTKSHDAKGKQDNCGKEKSVDKTRLKDKNEEVKNQSNSIKAEIKNKTKTDENLCPQLEKVVSTIEGSEKQKKAVDGEVLKTSNKSYKKKSSRSSKSRENTSKKLNEQDEKASDKRESGNKIESNASVKSSEQNEKSHGKIDEKDKHRGIHKTKSRDSPLMQEMQPKLTHEKSSRTHKDERNRTGEKSRRSHSKEKIYESEKQNESHRRGESKIGDKSYRSHSKEKIKLESSSRTDKREKTRSNSKEKVKEEPKKLNAPVEELKELVGSKENIVESAKTSSEEQKDGSKEKIVQNARTSSEEHKDGPKEKIVKSVKTSSEERKDYSKEKIVESVKTSSEEHKGGSKEKIVQGVKTSIQEYKDGSKEKIVEGAKTLSQEHKDSSKEKIVESAKKSSQEHKDGSKEKIVEGAKTSSQEHKDSSKEKIVESSKKSSQEHKDGSKEKIVEGAKTSSKEPKDGPKENIVAIANTFSEEQKDRSKEKIVKGAKMSSEEHNDGFKQKRLESARTSSKESKDGPKEKIVKDAKTSNEEHKDGFKENIVEGVKNSSEEQRDHTKEKIMEDEKTSSKEPKDGSKEKIVEGATTSSEEHKDGFKEKIVKGAKTSNEEHKDGFKENIVGGVKTSSEEQRDSSKEKIVEAEKTSSKEPKDGSKEKIVEDAKTSREEPKDGFKEKILGGAKTSSKEPKDGSKEKIVKGAKTSSKEHKDDLKEKIVKGAKTSNEEHKDGFKENIVGGVKTSSEEQRDSSKENIVEAEKTSSKEPKDGSKEKIVEDAKTSREEPKDGFKEKIVGGAKTSSKEPKDGSKEKIVKGAKTSSKEHKDDLKEKIVESARTSSKEPKDRSKEKIVESVKTSSEEHKENSVKNSQKEKKLNRRCEEKETSNADVKVNENNFSNQEISVKFDSNVVPEPAAITHNEQHLGHSNAKQELPRDIPKKRKYDLLEEDSKHSDKNAGHDDSLKPKIPKIDTETVVTSNENNIQVPQEPTLHNTELQQKTKDSLTTHTINDLSSELNQNVPETPVAEIPLPKTVETKKDALITKNKQNDVSLTAELSYESFARGIKNNSAIVVNSIQPEVQIVDDVETTPPTFPTEDKVNTTKTTPAPVETISVNENALSTTDIPVEVSKPSTTHDGTPNVVQSTNLPIYNDDLKEICAAEVAVKTSTQSAAPMKMLLQHPNVPEVPSSQSVYVDNVFSSASGNLGVQVLSGAINSTVKHFHVQDADMPLISRASTSRVVESSVTKPITMSCQVRRPMTMQSTPSCSTATVQEKSCLFTFNEDAETVNRENLNTSDLFHTSLGLEDISPTKLPLGSNQSLDFISPSTSIAEIGNSMNLVQSLGTSTINFINDVPDSSEIDIQQTSKQNSFGSNFVTRVTEICFVEKESTADHNYTLGDPLLGGNNEDKNILTTGLSLSNSPEEFQLNETHLEDLSFNENNFIEENATLEDLGLLLPCKKEKPDFDNIIDDAIPKPEDIQNSIKRLNMLVDISQGGQPKAISVDNTIDHGSNSDCNVSLGIDYAVNNLIFLGGREVTSQNNTFSTIPDIDNISIMESNVSSMHPSKQTLEDSVNETSGDGSNSLIPIGSTYASFLPSEINQKVVVEPVEQCTITSLDQLKKDYISETPKNTEKSKPIVNKTNRETNVKSSSVGRPSKFATFLETVKRLDASKNESSKVKDEMENFTVRRHARTPVFPPKKKTATQQHHTKSPPQNKKTEVSVDADAESKAAALSEAGTEGRIRVKTDLIKPTEGKVLISNDSLDYINEHDQSIASEVVLPFSKPSPSDHKTDIQEKKTSDLPKIDCGPAKPTKHARFDKLGNDYIMETILNVHTELKTRKSPIQDVKVPDRAIKKPDTSEARKRKSTPNDHEIKRDDKRPRKSDDESDKVRSGDHFKAHTRKTHDSNNKPTNDDIFDKLLREGPVNKVFTQRITDQTVKRESTQGNTLEALKNRGYTTVSENKKERNMTPSQSTISQLHDSSRYRENPRHSTHPDSDKRRDVKKPGYHTSSSNSQLERRYPEKRHISIPTVDTSPKRCD